MLCASEACRSTPHEPESHDGFRRVVAQVRGITWAACAATMEVALRRRLAGVDEISISEGQQTAVVTFLPGAQVFSAAAFREAVAEADVEVVSLDADVCGVIDGKNALRSSQHVEAPLLQLRGGNAVVGSTVCVNGRLNEQAQPYELDVMTVRPRS